MKPLYFILFGILCGLLAAGILLLINTPGRGSPIELPPAPTQAPLAVDVSGAVSNPGVYHLPAGSRVEDAISAAGGFTREAFTESVNLAAPLYDGSKVIVPVAAEQNPAESGIDTGESTTARTVFPININTAPLDVLVELPGIGEVKAQAIIDYRTEHGPFATLEAIQQVSGIGPATYEKLKDLITIY